MTIVTIPRKLAQQDDLIVIPRKKYEALVVFEKNREFIPTEKQKKALARAEANFKRGKTLSYNEFVQKLGFGN